MYQTTMLIPVLPERVFPLLCPRREQEWLDGWRATILRSKSGFAELGCVFLTGDGPSAERCTWIIVEHVPPKRIAFALVEPGLFAEILSVDLEAVENGTRLHWRREITPLSPEGEATVARRVREFDKKHAHLAQSLSHFLKTGQRLPAPT